MQTNELLTSLEVSRMLRVHPKTVVRWAIQGKLSSTKTPGGHRRYLKSQVMALLKPIDPDVQGEVLRRVEELEAKLLKRAEAFGGD